MLFIFCCDVLSSLFLAFSKNLIDFLQKRIFFLHDFLDVLTKEWLIAFCELFDMRNGLIVHLPFVLLSVWVLVYAIINEQKLLFLW